MPNIGHKIVYAQSSSLQDSKGGHEVYLTTNMNLQDQPVYFKGRVSFPLETARCLRAISALAGSRFYIPPAMLARILREADPVVTVGRDTLRFESFSSCCSAYARLDIFDEGFEAEEIHPGTTNVDFQSDMRSALAKIQSGSKLDLSIRAEEFELTSDLESVIEKKVDLPLRWIRGFAEVQGLQQKLQLALTMPRSVAVRFLKQIPRAKSRHDVWIAAQGKNLTISHHKKAGGIRVNGLERLRSLENIVQLCESVSVYADSMNTLTAWVVTMESQQFTLVLSSKPWRGFSGEGNLLKDLAVHDTDTDTSKILAALRWKDCIPGNELAAKFNESRQAMNVVLSKFASRGLVGYDVHSDSYFYRVLPFDYAQIESLHPRLESAKKIAATKQIHILEDGEKVFAKVESNNVTHRVLLSESGDTCTCTWYAKHEGTRGPCKHVLAAYIVTERKS
jgi:hypothetical protein